MSGIDDAALPSRLVGCHLPAAQSGMAPDDVFGMLLGEFTDGWWLVGEHISSSPEWSKGDISRKAEKWPGIPFEWIGEQTSAAVTAAYPPAGPTKEETDADIHDS